MNIVDDIDDDNIWNINNIMNDNNNDNDDDYYYNCMSNIHPNHQ